MLTLHFGFILTVCFIRIYYSHYILKANSIIEYTALLSATHISQLRNLILLQFYTMVLCIKSRLLVVNQNLEYYMKISNKYPSIDNSKQVAKIAETHALLTKAVGLINSLFSMRLIPNLFYILVANVFLVYIMHLELQNGDSQNITEDAGKFIWYFYGTIYVVIAIHGAHKTTSVAKQTSVILQELQNVSKNEKVLFKVSIIISL